MLENELLRGKAAIITGATRGIGRETALLFAKNGADLVLGGTSEEGLCSLQRFIESTYKVSCRTAAGDIADERTAKVLADKCFSEFGRVDILINNAGINSRIPFMELSLSEWKRMLEVNLDGAFNCCKAALAYMIEQHSGAIVNISSTAGKTAHANASASYGVSKAGINSLTQKLAYDMGKYSIRVNAICPGLVETDMTKQVTSEYKAEALKKIPLGRLGTVRNVADTALFLASDMAGFITGETVNVNGGSYMN